VVTVKVLSTMWVPAVLKNYDERVKVLSANVPAVNFDFIIPLVPGRY